MSPTGDLSGRWYLSVSCVLLGRVVGCPNGGYFWSFAVHAQAHSGRTCVRGGTSNLSDWLHLEADLGSVDHFSDDLGTFAKLCRIIGE